MNMIVIAILSVTTIAAILAAVLCIASRVMAVEVDERLQTIKDCLPGSNCGACGYPGCEGYAVALLSGDGIGANLCPPGGAVLVAQLSEILGVTAENVAQSIAVVRCMGDRDAQQTKMEYKGIETCKAAKQLFGGAGACAFGCMGYGDCQVVCPSDAVCMENGLARISPARCTGCTLCVKACPNQLITMESTSIATAVLCNTIEKGAIVRKKCSYGCIACGKCVRECPSNSIIMKHNLAQIDYETCTGCGRCVEVCITHCIQPLRPIQEPVAMESEATLV
ncbi:MAG: RnfABCDGE type electron transport complex subunit B [Oscillospiraceae bacterium]|nr:RnfABCDGE type electron transport complex subunit B [Oscillospiraceae bacterium]